MTRKDYPAIAGAIRATLIHLRTLPQADAVNTLHMPHAVMMTAEFLARLFAQENPRFDSKRFLDDCQPSSIPLPNVPGESIGRYQRRLAAAPQLLAALRLCVADLRLISDENGGSHGRTIDAALAAIEAAT